MGALCACGETLYVYVDDDDGTSPGEGGTGASTVVVGPSGSGGASTTSAGSGAGGSGSVSVLATGLPAVHVLPDPWRGRFYATVAGDSPQYGNSVVIVEAATKSVVGSVFVGSQPSTMAMSDDGSTLWVGLTGSYSIRRLDLSSDPPVAGATHVLPPGAWNDIAFAGPMVVLPDTTDSLGISLHRPDVSPSFAGVVIVDEGVPRPNQTPGHTGASRLTGGPPGWLFGFNNLHTGFGFYPLQVDPQGVTEVAEIEDFVSGFSTDIVRHGQRVFATNGAVIDVSDPAAPSKAGQFAHAGTLAVIDDGATVLMLSDDFDAPPTLRLLDATTFSVIDAAIVDLDANSLYDLGTPDGETLAVIDGGYSQAPELYLIDNPF